MFKLYTCIVITFEAQHTDQVQRLYRTNGDQAQRLYRTNGDQVKRLYRTNGEQVHRGYIEQTVLKTNATTH